MSYLPNFKIFKTLSRGSFHLLTFICEDLVLPENQLPFKRTLLLLFSMRACNYFASLPSSPFPIPYSDEGRNELYR